MGRLLFFSSELFNDRLRVFVRRRRAAEVGGQARRFLERRVDGAADAGGCLVVAEVFEHHAGGPQECRGVCDALARDVGRTAVHGFEHRQTIADVARRQEPEAADESAREIRDNVAVEVRHDHDVEVSGVHDEHHADGIDHLVVGFDGGKFLRDFVEDGAEQPVREFHDVCLVDARDLLSPMRFGVAEGGAADSLALFARDDLRRVHGVFVDFFLDADVEVFRVLAEGDEIDLGEGRPDGFVRLRGADVRIEVVLRAKRDVERTEALADGRRDGGFQKDVRLFKGGESGFRNQCAVSLVLGFADVKDFVCEVCARLFQDFEYGVRDFRADAVAFEYGDRVLRHSAFLPRHIVYHRADVLGGGAHDAVVVELVLDVVRDPARRAREHEERREEVARDAENLVGETAVEVDVARHAHAFLLAQIAFGDALKAHEEVEFPFDSLLRREPADMVTDDFGTRVGQRVDGMADAVDEPRGVVQLLVQQTLDDALNGGVVGIESDSFDDLVHHVGDAHVGAAVARPF